MTVKESMSSVLDDWPKWRHSGLAIDHKPEFIKTFGDGLNHDVGLIEIIRNESKSNHVLKRFRGPHPNAIKAQRWAHELGLAPEIHYTDPNFMYCVMDYIGANTISPDSISSENLNAIAIALSQFHNAPAPEHTASLSEFDLLEFCSHYLKSAGDRAQQIHQQVLIPLHEFIADTTPVAFCHNDLVVGNCFISDERAQFIDWEYAQIHNPWFDLAAIIYYLQLSDEQARDFLDSYKYGWSLFVGTSIFYTSQLALLWADMLWHLAKFGCSFWPRLEVKLKDLEQLLLTSKLLL